MAKLFLIDFGKNVHHPIFQFLDGPDFAVFCISHKLFCLQFDNQMMAYYSLPGADRKNYTSVCKIGFIPMVNLMDETTLTNGTLIETIINGHLDVVMWLVNKFSFDIYPTIDIACKNGHLDIVKQLSETNKGNCTYNAMNFASANGHFNIVKWLHENRKEGCTHHAVDMAELNGHPDIVEWLRQNRPECA